MAEEWKAKWAGEFASGALRYKDCVIKRGRLRGNVTVSLNEATEYTKTVKLSIQAGNGVPNNQDSINVTRTWLFKIQENVSKLDFYNEKMKGFFSPADRVDTNADWKTTNNYCTFYENNFLATRQNLFKILFFLIEHADKQRILEAVDKSRRNFAFIVVPDGPLSGTHPDASDAEQVHLLEDDLSLSGSFHGFNEGDDVAEDEDGEVDGDDPDATVRRYPGADGGMATGEVQPTNSDLGWAFGGARNKTPAAPIFPTSTTSDFFPGQNTMTTSTVKNPIHFADLHKQGEYQLFSGPSIFSSAVGAGVQQKEGLKSPWEEVRPGLRQAPVQEPRSDRVFADRGNNSDASALVQMFSNSLTSTFSAKNMIDQKWDGDPATWDRFAFAWTKCHTHMEALHMSDAAKFSELQRCVTGTAKLYIDQLPSFLDSSYWTSLQLLQNVYSSRKTTVRTIVNKLMSMPTCQPTYESRLRLHAQICGYKSSLNSMSIKPEDALLAWELTFIENAFDTELKKQWVRYCEKNRNLSAPLGYDLTFEALSNKILTFITESYKIAGEKPQIRGGTGGQGQGGRRWVGNAAAASAAPASQPGNNGQDQSKPKSQKGGKGQSSAKSSAGKNGASNASVVTATAAAASAPRSPPPPKNQYAKKGGTNKQTSLYKSGCAFCQKENGFNTHPHRWNLGCPLIKLEVLPPEKVRDIVRQKRLCTTCLMPNHTSANCPSPDYVKCSVPNCNQKHFRVFHNRPEPKKVTWSAAAANESQ